MLVQLGNFIARISDSRSKSLLAVALAVVCFGLFDYVVDVAMTSLDVNTRLHAAAQATIVGLGAGLSGWLLLSARRERRNIIRDELARLTELNHSLRNSLQVISDAHFFAANNEHKKIIRETVKKMDATLRRLLPVIGESSGPVTNGPTTGRRRSRFKKRDDAA